MVLLSLGIASAAFGDSMASSWGAFSNPIDGAASASSWTLANVNHSSSLSFAGASSLVIPDQSFTLGELLLTNGGQGGIGNGEHTIDLTLDIDFAQPNQRIRFVDTISLTINNGSQGTKVAFTSIPAPQTFASDGLSYIVTFNGMFDAPTGGNNISASGLSASNPHLHEADSAAHAYLQGTLSSGVQTNPAIIVHNPEPQAIAMLFLVICLAFVGYRRRATT